MSRCAQTAIQNGIELKFQASPSLHKSDSQIAFVVSRVNRKTFLSFLFLSLIIYFLQYILSSIEIQTRKMEEVTDEIVIIMRNLMEYILCRNYHVKIEEEKDEFVMNNDSFLNF